MAGSTIGTAFRITTWGESHGPSIGVIVDGCPAGLMLSEADIQQDLDRRKPGQSRYTTSRAETDQVHILSGLMNGVTTGCPIALEVINQSQRSSDYDSIAEVFRPGHADYSFQEKYKIRDYRGGGRSSGRETIGRVAAGAIARKLLHYIDVNIIAYTRQIGDICCEEIAFSQIDANPLHMPDVNAAKKAQEYLDQLKSEKDSAGGIIECIVTGLPAGLGDPVFDKLDANLAKAMFSIGAVKGFEIGDGFLAATKKGSENNDAFITDGSTIQKATNHAGGILGGISDGSDLIMRVAFKPTPSIAKEQHSVTLAKTPVTLSIEGRHDPVIVPRAVVVVEAMAAITLADALLMNLGSTIFALEQFRKSDN